MGHKVKWDTKVESRGTPRSCKVRYEGRDTVDTNVVSSRTPRSCQVGYHGHSGTRP